MTPAAVRSRIPGPGIGIEDLTATLELEGRLLEELLDVVRGQRVGIVFGDAERLDDSVFAAHRLIRTLTEARRHLHTIVSVLAGGDATGLDDVEALFDAEAAVVLRNLRDRVCKTARTLSSEMAVNRLLIRQVLRNVEAACREAADAPGQRPARPS